MNLWSLLKSHLFGPYRNVLLLVIVLQTIQTFAALTLSLTHPMIAAEASTAAEIVDLVLHGIGSEHTPS